MIIIPNQKLLEVVDHHVSMINAFAMINEGVLSQSVRGLSDIITRPGHINVDYADIRTIMKDRGLAVMGTGKASGAGRARAAALEAISSPLLENMSVVGAHGVLCNITGGKDLGLHEISEAASVVYEQAHEDANIIIGSVIDDNLKDEVIVTIIATDFEHAAAQQVQEEVQQMQPKEESSFVEPSFAKASSYAEATKDMLEDRPIKEEEHICAAPVMEKQESVIEPLPLQTEMEAVEEEKHETLKHHADFFDQADTFGCAVDSKDLDIPTFMRQK